MLDILWNIFSFIVALGVLVTIHEYGHFWVARKMEVKVLKFSVGFGKPLYSKVSSSGTEYVLASIPLGGYVKMLDEREGDVPEAEKHLAFNNKPVTSRIAIVAAGPIANFLLAIFVYWWMFILGVPAIKPYLGDVPENSIAAEAGLVRGTEIISIDNKKVANWEEVNLAIVKRMGEKTQLSIETRHPDESIVRKHQLDLLDWQVDPKRPEVMGSLGINVWTPDFPTTLGEVVSDLPAAKAGLMKGDKIESINGVSVNKWSEIVEIVTANPGSMLSIDINRQGEIVNFKVTPAAREINGQTRGYLGVRTPELSKQQIKQIESMRFRHQYGFFEAFGQGIDKTWEITLLTFQFIGKIFSGEVSPQNLSGPITIAQGAGAYASFGFVFFLGFLGMISVNLGIVNLLPIPVLDGGHLLYYIVELIRGKPLSESVQEMGYKIGLMLVLGLMIFTIMNDIGRL